MEAIYNPSNVTPAFQLDWGLTFFWRQSMIQECEWRADLASANDSSGIRIIKHRALDNETSQFFIRAPNKTCRLCVSTRTFRPKRNEGRILNAEY